MATTSTPLGYAELAEKLGVTIGTVRTYNERARAHRAKAAETGDVTHILQGDLPEPDGRFGQSPYWHESTINRWLKERPGQDHSNKRDKLTSAQKRRREEALAHFKAQQS